METLSDEHTFSKNQGTPKSDPYNSTKNKLNPYTLKHAGNFEIFKSNFVRDTSQESSIEDFGADELNPQAKTIQYQEQPKMGRDLLISPEEKLRN